LNGNSITSLAADTQDKWFGTWQGGVSKFDGTTWTNYIPANAFNGTASVPVNAIAIDAKGNIWFGLAQGGGVSELKK
jgi:ligand-binding sensor domain-containing protein